VAFSSLAFGGLAIIACFFLEDIGKYLCVVALTEVMLMSAGPKMTPKIEVFLENDVQAEKNVYH
jgi:hypothetical protein